MVDLPTLSLDTFLVIENFFSLVIYLIAKRKSELERADAATPELAAA